MKSCKTCKYYRHVKSWIFGNHGGVKHESPDGFACLLFAETGRGSVIHMVGLGSDAVCEMYKEQEVS